MFTIYILVATIISGLILTKDYRAFKTGIFFFINAFILVLIIIYNIFNLLYQVSYQLGNNIVIISFIAFFISIIILGIYLIYNSRILADKEGLSLIVKILCGYGLNLIGLLICFLILFTPLIFIPQHVKLFIKLLFYYDLFLTITSFFYLLYSVLYQFIPYHKNINYLIVLGCYAPDLKITPLLKSRVDTAINYYNKQIIKPYIIVSGGQGSDEKYSEAYVMKEYLKLYIPENDIIIEDKSTSTMQNLQYSCEIIDNKDAKILVVSSNYHVLRALFIARELKIKADGIGAPTPFYFLTSALLREYIAIIKMYLLYFISIIVLISILVIATSIK